MLYSKMSFLAGMDGVDYQDTSIIKKTRNYKRIGILIVVGVLIILLLVSLFRFLNSSGENAIIPTPAPETINTTVTPEGTPSPAPGLDQGNLSITIQNGSGEAGVAKTASDFLTEKGYTISSTGNADNFDYQDVTIQIKEDSSEYLDLLESDLSEKYNVGTTSADLSSSFSTDALVIIGK